MDGLVTNVKCLRCVRVCGSGDYANVQHPGVLMWVTLDCVECRNMAHDWFWLFFGRERRKMMG